MTRPDPHISEWIAPSEDIAANLVESTLGDALKRAAWLWPEHDALVYRHQPAVPSASWTYAELDAMTARLANALLRFGFQPGERIAVWGPNYPEWVLLEYAIARVGMVIVALNPLYRSAELGFALNDSGAVGIFHAETIGATIPAEIIGQIRSGTPALRQVLSFKDIPCLIDEAAGPAPAVAVDPGATAMIQYTSGTTGLPKAVRLSHRALVTTGRNSYRSWQIGEGSRVCFGFPLFHVGGSGNSIPGACLNGATALPLVIFKPDITLDILERECCTAFIGVPTMLIAMLDHPSFVERNLSAMRSIIVGGAPVSLDLLQRCQDGFGAEVINCYGQTETSGVTTITRCDDTVEQKTGTSGQALEGVSVSIRDMAGRVLPHGQPGELHYRGPGGMTGYGSREDDPVIDGGWIASGDLAHMDSDGFVTIVGRKKEMIIRGGENLSPVEIESYMREHEAVADVAVISLPDEKYGEVACAVVRRRDGSSATEEDIRNWCIERISRWKVPEYVTFIDEFPMTPSGKIQKFKLQEAMGARLRLTANSEEKTT